MVVYVVTKQTAFHDVTLDVGDRLEFLECPKELEDYVEPDDEQLRRVWRSITGEKEDEDDC